MHCLIAFVLASIAGLEPAFHVTGNLTAPREYMTATLLADGKVLLAGGRRQASAILNSAELYDPASGTSTAAAAPMTAARYLHTATLLADGKVLLAGGSGGASGPILNTAELYDPIAGTFTATGFSMTSARQYHTATLLLDGMVLIAGGGRASAGQVVSSAELYDPTTGMFMATNAPMTAAREYHTATRLPDGKVLIAGGFNGSSNLNTAELYDPVSRTFTATSTPMTSIREYHTATRLPDGRVLLAGGYNGSETSKTAELYDPASGTFSAIAGIMTSPRELHVATLSNGKVLITGGYSGQGFLKIAELYDPATGTFTATTDPMTSNRYVHTATLLPGGKVLIAGGSNGTALNTTEVYDPGPVPTPAPHRRAVKP
jgi:hypothetical protein